ncbi:hypothetical protein F5Y14DRAFT_316469 [Nemania sp. NC0429]|nr:hypothetical protein F5Y14DRAFT_316469 [Nemania sp. NC0429]
MASSQTLILDTPKLDTLPADILFMVLSYLDTAQSVAHLAASCRGLCRLVSAEGWRIFVKNRFRSLVLPTSSHNEDWAALARVLTAQSRDWDRRAFVFHSLTPPKPWRHGVRRDRGAQSIPGAIIVDAHLQRRGHVDEELVVWGSGEDVVARIQRKSRATAISESWHCSKGSDAGFVSGKDDTTAISIVKSHSFGENEDAGVVVGRANGDLRLLSVGATGFGGTLMHFRPSPSSSAHQQEIWAIDIDSSSSTMVAGTRESVWLYPIQDDGLAVSDKVVESPVVDPITSISLKATRQPSPFDFIRSTKMLNKDTIAVALNRSLDPVRALTITPTGLEVFTPPRILDEHHSMGTNPRTVRALLPIDVRSIASGGGNVLLSSWDDGTIRLQDLRTSSPVDRVYQDNFEVVVPINALISYGLERFVAGSAYSHTVKIFDFRWARGYYHTDSLPCTTNSPYPTPKPPAIVDKPDYHDDRPFCNHVIGRLCQWHSLSRHDFYRPNCNIYLPLRNSESSPIYSLAKPSDISPTIYAGLSGLLVEFTLKSGVHSPSTSNSKPLYSRQRDKLAILETGDGSAVLDISKCQMVPEIRRQSFSHENCSTVARKHHRLDEALQNPLEWQNFELQVS